MQEMAIVQQVRSTKSFEAERLRDIAVLSAAGLIDFIPISLFQLGVIKKLLDPPGEIFDSPKVNSSKEAQVAGLPDGTVSLLLYAVNILLAGAAMSNKKHSKLFSYMLAANTIGQAAGGAYYLYNMVKVQKKVCLYCVTGALINFATLLPLKKLFTKY